MDQKQQSKIEQRSRAEVAGEIQKQTTEISVDQIRALRVGRYLVFNEQYAQFLLWLQQHSIPIAVKGKPLFYNDCPQTKLHIKKDDGVYIDWRIVK